MTTNLYLNRSSYAFCNTATHKPAQPFYKVLTLILLFTYATFPMWLTWTCNHFGYREIVPNDVLLAMGWLPISAAIISLSFMKFGLKEKLKSIACFTLYNAIAISSILYFIGF